MTDFSDMLLIGITLWAIVSWGTACISDLVKYRTRGRCIIEGSAGFNIYHFLGILYLLILLALRKTGLSEVVKMIITVGFVGVAVMSSYRAMRMQGLYENGLCIPEQNCELTAIKYYKWSGLIEEEGYIPLYLKVVYNNMLNHYGIKVVKFQVPIQKRAIVQSILKSIQGCKEV